LGHVWLRARVEAPWHLALFQSRTGGRRRLRVGALRSSATARERRAEGRRARCGRISRGDLGPPILRGRARPPRVRARCAPSPFRFLATPVGSGPAGGDGKPRAPVSCARERHRLAGTDPPAPTRQHRRAGRAKDTRSSTRSSSWSYPTRSRSPRRIGSPSEPVRSKRRRASRARMPRAPRPPGDCGRGHDTAWSSTAHGSRATSRTQSLARARGTAGPRPLTIGLEDAEACVAPDPIQDPNAEQRNSRSGGHRPSLRTSGASDEWSGREDLNLRPLRPERSALAKLSHAPSYSSAGRTVPRHPPRASGKARDVPASRPRRSRAPRGEHAAHERWTGAPSAFDRGCRGIFPPPQCDRARARRWEGSRRHRGENSSTTCAPACGEPGRASLGRIPNGSAMTRATRRFVRHARERVKLPSGLLHRAEGRAAPGSACEPEARQRHPRGTRGGPALTCRGRRRRRRSARPDPA
jgi:hypothetical protein